MARIQFLSTNRYNDPATTLTASSAALGLAVGASQNPDRSYVWRSLTAATATPHSTIEIDLGSVQAVSAVALANVTILTGGAVLLYERGDAGSPGTANLVATIPAEDAVSRVAFIAFASQSHRHWRLVWTNPGAVSGYAEVGYVFLGVPFEPSVNISVPSSFGYIDPSVPVQAVDGQTTFTARTKYRAGGLRFDALSSSDFDSLFAIYRAQGVAGNFFIVIDDTLSWSAMLARFSSAFDHGFSISAGRYDVGVSIEEAR